MDVFEAIIEVPKGSTKKYQLKKGKLVFDETFPNGLVLPANYGFIPKTCSGDKDALDVFIISKPIKPKTKVKFKPIGVIRSTDDGEQDDKIIGVLPTSKRKTYPKNTMKKFLESYKGKRVKVIKLEGAQKSKQAIIEAKKCTM